MVGTLRVKRTKHAELPDPKKLLAGARKVKVGFPKSKSKQANINKAIWNEFGTSRGIPERPFMRNTMRNNRGKYRKAMISEAAGILKGTIAVRIVLAKLGIVAQGDMQQEITSLSSPPNAPSTIRAKGSSNPLIDTGAMRQAVTWEIKND